MKPTPILVGLFLTITGVFAGCNKGLNVKTNYGPVQGHYGQNNSDTSVREFLGIPYASAPRFTPPTSPKKWSTPLQASRFGPGCYITTIKSAPGFGSAPVTVPPAERVDEECLSVNVWTPSKARLRELKKKGVKRLPVMLWTYGGGFMVGSSDYGIYNGAKMVRDQDVVVVSYNYRLGIFGYPSSRGLGDGPTNFGLLDVRAAVEWTRDNIHRFGGDPCRITLFGQSAGSRAVDAYLYFSSSAPIIHAAILQSGTINNTRAEREPGYQFAKLAEGLGCPSDDTAALECVRGKPAKEVQEKTNELGLQFVPTPDGKTVFADSWERSKRGEFARVPLLIGAANEETPGSTLPARLATAHTYVCPAERRARSASQHTPTWLYRFYGNFPAQSGALTPGPFHGSEITQVFGTFNQAIATEEQRSSSRTIQDLWVRFAGEPEKALAQWPRYEPHGERVLRLAWENGDEVGLGDVEEGHPLCEAFSG
ncbi:alpha/beta-hydrolase [Ascodesmis nigricans]|uniref:Carboxylic ester hydrolase n=1 Tax=Ascodesmis nigricans TaxID=341454 RepID=A0A4S2N3K8_9PEZI|nr:alpha/beta-hydrolase [Ascodesmis nigricans]